MARRARLVLGPAGHCRAELNWSVRQSRRPPVRCGLLERQALRGPGVSEPRRHPRRCGLTEQREVRGVQSPGGVNVTSDRALLHERPLPVDQQRRHFVVIERSKVFERRGRHRPASLGPALLHPAAVALHRARRFLRTPLSAGRECAVAHGRGPATALSGGGDFSLSAPRRSGGTIRSMRTRARLRLRGRGRSAPESGARPGNPLPYMGALSYKASYVAYTPGSWPGTI